MFGGPTIKRSYEEGARLFVEGEEGGPLFFILSGEVELSVKSKITNTRSVVAVKGKKSVLGILSFLEGCQRNATGTAKTKVDCIVIDQGQRRKLLKAIPQWFSILVKDLSKTLRRLSSELSDISTQMTELEPKHRHIKTKFDPVEEELTKLEAEVKSWQEKFEVEKAKVEKAS